MSATQPELLGEQIPAPQDVTQDAQPDNVLAIIERASLNPNIDVEKMRALLDMHERILSRNAEQAFNAAMTKAQIAMPPVACDKTNLHTKSKYPSLEAVQKSIKAIYLDHGFTCTFAEGNAPPEGKIHVIGTVRHVEGHTELFHRYAAADTTGPSGTRNKTEVQGSQSTVSYLSRRLLCSIWGVTVVDDDKDGNEASPTISKKQLADLTALAEETKSDIGKFCQYFKIDKLENLPVGLYKDAVKAFEKKRGQR